MKFLIIKHYIYTVIKETRVPNGRDQFSKCEISEGPTLRIIFLRANVRL